MENLYIIIIIIILIFFFINHEYQLIRYSDDLIMFGLLLEPMNEKNIEPMLNISYDVNQPYDVNQSYDVNQLYINDDNIQHNYSFRRDRNGLGNSKGFEPKYIHENENSNYINQIDKPRDKPNIDPLYKENKIISNDKLFLTENTTNIIPLFLTLNDYNIMKGGLNKNIIDPIL